MIVTNLFVCKVKIWNFRNSNRQFRLASSIIPETHCCLGSFESSMQTLQTFDRSINSPRGPFFAPWICLIQRVHSLRRIFNLPIVSSFSIISSPLTRRSNGMEWVTLLHTHPVSVTNPSEGAESPQRTWETPRLIISLSFIYWKREREA